MGNPINCVNYGTLKQRLKIEVLSIDQWHALPNETNQAEQFFFLWPLLGFYPVISTFRPGTSNCAMGSGPSGRKHKEKA